MALTIQHKRSQTTGDTPTASDIAQGEIALNLADLRLFTKDHNNAIQRIGGEDVLDNIFGLGSSDLFSKVKRIQIVACGTSLHAGRVAANWFSSIAELPCPPFGPITTVIAPPVPLPRVEDDDKELSEKIKSEPRLTLANV